MDDVSLISIDGYIDSVRFLGLTTNDSIKELVDNSIDAESKNIYVNIFKDNEKIQITIEDDGNGINKEEINSILSFGGRNNILHGTVGKFGWGLPSAACCQTIRTELYSKVDGDSFYYSYIDLEEFKINGAIIPRAISKKPDFELQIIDKKGSFIHLKDCDNLDYKTIETLSEKLINDLGETYRYYLSNGLNLFVNNKKIQLIDPLLQIEGSKFIDTFGKSKLINEIQPIIFEDIIDEITGKPAEIQIKLAIMDFDIIKGSPNYRKNVKSIFNINNQGFYLVRNNREIGRALSLDIFTKHNDFNYFRGEIIFPPCLDKYFGVHTNKSRYTVKGEIKSKIKGLTEKLISQIRKLSKDFVISNISNNDNTSSSRAEKIISEIDNGLTKNIKDKNRINIKATLEQEEKKGLEIAKINSNKLLTPDQKSNEIKKIEENYKLPYKFTFEGIGKNNTFYDVDFLGTQTIIKINTNHSFYEKVYLILKEKHLDLYLQILIYTLVKAEQNIIGLSNEKEEYYDSEKVEWSSILKKLLNKVDETDYNT